MSSTSLSLSLGSRAASGGKAAKQHEHPVLHLEEHLELSINFALRPRPALRSSVFKESAISGAGGASRYQGNTLASLLVDFTILL